MADLPSGAGDLLDFWFRDAPRDRRWFEKDAAFDREIRDRFLPTFEQAAAGRLDHWKAFPGGCLALIVALDQFPRNMFRGTPRAFASDDAALSAARHAVGSGFDRAMQPCERLFVYLPYEHAESLAEQEEACALTLPLAAYPETHDVHRFAVAHRDIVARFGRFPHRNAILGRPSTPEELAFLRQPGSSF